MTNPTINSEHLKLAFDLVVAMAGIVKSKKEIPSGHLYAMVMGTFNLDEYQKIEGFLLHTGLVEKKGDLLKWVG